MNNFSKPKQYSALHLTSMKKETNFLVTSKEKQMFLLHKTNLGKIPISIHNYPFKITTVTNILNIYV